MLNTQPREAPIRNDGRTLEVVRIWYSIQGEGPLAGCPAVFVRLAGCNLVCPGCDTDYTTGRQLLTYSKIEARATELAGWPRCKQIILTGGEPLRQSNVEEYVLDQLRNGWDVQIETNGTIGLPRSWSSLDPDDMGRSLGRLIVVCSPKTVRIHPTVEEFFGTYYKYVLAEGAVSEADGLPTRVLGKTCYVARPSEFALRSGRVFVQPEDTSGPGDGLTAAQSVQNERNLETTARRALAFGYRLTVQLHKLAGLP